MVILDQAGRGAATLRFAAASSALTPFVENFWIEETLATGHDRAGWRIVPDDAPHVLWHAYGDRSEIVLVGARARFADIDKRGRLMSIGARLIPGSIPALFGCAASDVTDLIVPLSEIVGARQREMWSRLSDVAPPLRVSLLDDVLRRCMTAGRPIDQRVAAFTSLAGGPAARVGETSRAIGLSARTLRHVAMREIGLTPRQVVRVRRVHLALRHGLARPGNWSRAAAIAGYADQAHLTHDFRVFLGETPRAFAVRGETQQP